MANKQKDPTDMSIGERVKLVRIHNGLSMGAFGERLEGMSGSSIHRWENNLTKISKRSLKLISDKFGVNMEFLLNGEGEMYTPKKPHEELGAELGKLLREKGEYTEFKQRLITHILKLPEEHWAVIIDLINSIVDEELNKIKKSEEN